MNDITLLDGGMGQELLASTGAAPTELWATQVMLDQPLAVRAVHDAYFKAGADIATTNTYALHHDRLEPAGCDDMFTELHLTACRIANEARDAHGTGLVAGSLGPLRASYRPDLTPPPDEAAEAYAEIVRLHAPMVDMYLIETMSSLKAARGALMGASVSGKPVWLSVSVDDADGNKLRSGEAVADVLPLLAEFTPEAVLINCSTPEAVSDALKHLVGAGLPFGAYANGFTHITEAFREDRPTVDALTARTDLDPATYAGFTDRWIAAGATIVGGCCEVGPAHIAEIARRLKA